MLPSALKGFDQVQILLLASYPAEICVFNLRRKRMVLLGTGGRGGYRSKLHPSCLKYVVFVKHMICILKTEEE